MAHSPHDALFRYTFGQLEHAGSLLRAVLPAHIRSQVDWSSLRLLPGTRVDRRLRRHQSDLLFSVRIAGRLTLVYVLIEHKRRGERWAVLQQLGYVVGLWQELRRSSTRGRFLPRVLPILVLQGSGAHSVTKLEELFEPASQAEDDLDLDARQPRFEPIVVRLEDCSRELRRGLAMTLLSKLTIEAMVYLPGARAGQVQVLFSGWATDLAQLARSSAGAEALQALWSYVVEVVDIAADSLIEIVEEAMDPVIARKFRTPASQWREEGRQEGRHEGRQEGALLGRRDQLRRQLTARFGELPEQVVARVAGATVDQLDTWAVLLLDAGSLDEVFGC